MFIMSTTAKLTTSIVNEQDLLIINVSKHHVVQQNTHIFKKIFELYDESPSHVFNKVVIMFEGFANVDCALYKFKPIKQYCRLLLSTYPDLWWLLSADNELAYNCKQFIFRAIMFDE